MTIPNSETEKWSQWVCPPSIIWMEVWGDENTACTVPSGGPRVYRKRSIRAFLVNEVEHARMSCFVCELIPSQHTHLSTCPREGERMALTETLKPNMAVHSLCWGLKRSILLIAVALVFWKVPQDNNRFDLCDWKVSFNWIQTQNCVTLGGESMISFQADLFGFKEIQ